MRNDTSALYGVRLVGGELVACSDEGPPAPPGGPALHELIERAVPPAAHVLVAGPHHESLVDGLVARFARVTCLVRSRPDAERLGRRHADAGPRVTILCGSLDKLPGSEPYGPYDAIVAAGGLGRLGTPDGSPLTWAESLRLGTGMLADGGTLVLGLENELGVHRLVDPEPPEPPDLDIAGLATGGVATVGLATVGPAIGGLAIGGPAPGGLAPAGPAELGAALADAGLAVGRCYAAFPEPGRPAVLLPAELLERRLDGHELPALLISAALSGSPESGDGAGQRPVLSDPRRLAASALARGLGAALAPGWTVVARRGPAAAAATAAPGELPLGLGHDGAGAADADAVAHWAVTWELRHDGTRWERIVLASRTNTPARRDHAMVPARARRPLHESGPRASGRVVRDPARLAGPVPYGRLLDDLMLAGCARGDLPGLRGLLRSYARWLAEQAPAGELPGRLVFAETTNVVVADDDRFVLLDPSWGLAEPVSFPVALARLLRQFALRLVTGGHPHPWPSTLDLDGIAVTLLAMAGHPGDRGLLGVAVALEAELIAAREGLPGHMEARLIAELAYGVPRRPLSHRDALRAVRRLADDLRQERGRADWLDARLRDAEAATERGRKLEAECAERQAELRALRRSAAFRLGRLITFPVRFARHVLRRLVR